MRTEQPAQRDDGVIIRRLREGDREKSVSVVLVMPEDPTRAGVAETVGGGRRDEDVSHLPGGATALDGSRDLRARGRHTADVGSLARRRPFLGAICAMRAFEIATRAPLLPLLRVLVWLAGVSMSDHIGPAALMDTLASLPDVSGTEIIQ